MPEQPFRLPNELCDEPLGDKKGRNPTGSGLSCFDVRRF
jgi:hypothetical protein